MGEKCLKEGVGWLLLNCINTLQKNSETVKAFNNQLMAKCECHQTCVAASIEVLPSPVAEKQ